MNKNLLNVVKDIIAKYGETVLAEPKRVSALFADLAREEPKPHKNALVKCLEHGFTPILKGVRENERDNCKQRLAQRLHEEEGLDLGLCGETVKLLAVALFGEEETQMAQPTPTVQSKPSFPSAPVSTLSPPLSLPVSGQVGFTDPRDGKFYKTIKINGQVWMAENLNYAAESSKCYNNEEANGAKYGRLYDWETAKKACPDGWHLPSIEEWDTLVDFVGGKDIAGKKLKSKIGWNDNGNGIDEYGFSALPGGLGYSGGNFITAGNYGTWWSSTEGAADGAWGRGMDYDGEHVGRDNYVKTYLFSVRCVQD